MSLCVPDACPLCVSVCPLSVPVSLTLSPRVPCVPDAVPPCVLRVSLTLSPRVPVSQREVGALSLRCDAEFRVLRLPYRVRPESYPRHRLQLGFFKRSGPYGTAMEKAQLKPQAASEA
ncbi:hypothetical protein DUI87_33192 [Hirundo rustica rustica]|uniref:Uncharacterized protein n=1 Tax=Hirundo rustica rustica TaxID=333673 RepID=A0A3M0IMX9_HIRRU|nr:hypothetical protein DUI87_33192 [Hirundo rustica rustica]